MRVAQITAENIYFEIEHFPDMMTAHSSLNFGRFFIQRTRARLTSGQYARNALSS